MTEKGLGEDRNSRKDKNMGAVLERMLVEHAAPTLAGMKTGNMFHVKHPGTDIRCEIRRVNRMLTGKGVHLIPLRRSEESTLLYVFRPDRLRQDLDHSEAESILCRKGYPCGNPVRCLSELIRHIRMDEGFPHEVGLFLGYPPADVRCFMEHPREGVTCIGCWKSYGCREEAEMLFARYKKCTDVYRKAYNDGRPLACLTVKSFAGKGKTAWQ